MVRTEAIMAAASIWKASGISIGVARTGDHRAPASGRGPGVVGSASKREGRGAPGFQEILDLANVGGLKTLGAFDYLELHIVSFGQRAESFGDDGGVVNEDIFTTVLRDEAEPLCVIEPLNRALRHCYNLLKGSPQAPGKPPALVAG
jgi:hypothetical protein